MATCVFCDQFLDNGTLIVTLGQKGCDGILKANEQRSTNIFVIPGQMVHAECRRKYINHNEIEYFKRKKRTFDMSESESTGCSRRSTGPQFSYTDNCLFCGIPDKYGGKKKQFQLITVRTKNFQQKVLEFCASRSDKWSETVQGRLAFVNDLHAADAVYHKVCNGNFRSGKQVPKCFHDQDNSSASQSKKQKTGRPEAMLRFNAFEKVMENLRQNDDEQTTIGDLLIRMRDSLDSEEPYSFRYMKKQLLHHFGGEIIISEVCGRKNIVSFRRKASVILQDFFSQPRSDHDDKDRIVKAAAELIKSDIKCIEQSLNVYPTSLDMATVSKSMSFLPQSLQILLRNLFVGKEKDMKTCSIGQAIMQAARPRALILPLQLGLGVEMHHHFASRFLVDTLATHGFSCSYTEVQKFEKSAALEHGTDIVGFTPGHFMQYVADNVDHNIRTIDGHGTFHGMGLIACITPRIDRTSVISRLTVSAKDLSEVGRINIQHYVQRSEGLKALTYAVLKQQSEEARVSSADTLWKISMSLGKCPRPGWSGMMRMLKKDEYPGQSSIIFLPMIDLDPGDLTCLNSTLQFISKHAMRYGVTPILTFDQPLWWKAMTIIENELNSSHLKSIILRLGGFHILMSFLGSIGHLMSGSGLEEILEIIFAVNTIPKLLYGKYVARAIRGHFLIDGALNTLLTSKTFGLKLPNEKENTELVTDEVYPPCKISNHCGCDLPVELAAAADLYDNVMVDTKAVRNCFNILQPIAERIKEEKSNLEQNRTAALWLQYMDMIDLVKAFLRSERTGNWNLHLDTLVDMIPFMAASGHNLYVKSLNIYLQKMYKLEEHYPHVYKSFVQGGLQVVRRSDQYWAGLSPDLVIEQVLMRSIKTAGGLTRGRGMTEMQRLVWVMSSPVTAEINNAMQELTNINYQTNEQHKDLSQTRQDRDLSDTLKILDLLRTRSPFAESEHLHNIVNGVTAHSSVNVEHAKEIGSNILKEMNGKNVIGFTFRKKSQAITMGSKSNLKMNDGETVQIDPQLLFQRLVIAGTQAEELSEAFKFELCSYPPALFDSKDVILSANKPQLAKAIWDAAPTDDGPSQNCVYVLDGGALLQRVPWETGKTYADIVKCYISYIQKKYGHSAIIVFDGYDDQPSTKDCAHKKRGSRCGRKIAFTANMILNVKKQEFLSNSENKQRFINFLGEELATHRYEVHNAKGDADILIVRTAVAAAEKNTTVLVGDDTDLLILLCHHAKGGKLYFMPEPKKASSTCRKYLDVNKTRECLGEDVINHILFVHAILGCDTTSRIFGIGKAVSLHLIKENANFRNHAKTFLNSQSTKDEVVAAGERAMVCIYKGGVDDNLNAMRLQRFQVLVTLSNTSIHPRNLPPTSSATKFHSLRVYLQVQEWMGNSLNPEAWGWKTSDSSLIPINTDQDPAPKSLLELVRCQCKSGCSTMRCKCRRQGLDCSIACSECRGVCRNMTSTEEDDNDLDS